mgnify:CR=1 FL=1
MIYVVLLNWNGYEETKQCLRSIDQDKASTKSIVVDNGSVEKEGLRLKENFPHIHLIENRKNLGFARGVNQGLSHALSFNDCEQIFILNNDAKLIDSTTLSSLKSYIEDRDDLLVSPTILFSDSNIMQNTGGDVSILFGGSVSRAKGQAYSSQDHQEYPDYLSGCAIFGNRSVFEKLDFFYEPYFAYFEDIEFCLKAKKKGVRLEVLRNIAIEHQHSAATKNYSLLKQYLLLRNSLIFAKRNLSGWRKRTFFVSCIVVRIGLMLKDKQIPTLDFLISSIRDGFSEKLSTKYFNPKS